MKFTLDKIAFALLLLISPTQAVAKSLTASEIKKELSGNSFTFKEDNVTGVVWFRTNGVVKFTIKKGNANFPSGYTDTGVWFTKGNRYCSNYERRGLRCVRLKRVGNGKLKITRGNVLTKR